MMKLWTITGDWQIDTAELDWLLTGTDMIGFDVKLYLDEGNAPDYDAVCEYLLTVHGVFSRWFGDNAILLMF